MLRRLLWVYVLILEGTFLASNYWSALRAELPLNVLGFASLLVNFNVMRSLAHNWSADDAINKEMEFVILAVKDTDKVCVKSGSLLA